MVISICANNCNITIKVDIVLNVYKTLTAMLEICLILDDLCMLVSSFAELKTYLSLLGFHCTSATFSTLSFSNLFVTVYIMKKYILQTRKMDHLKQLDNQDFIFIHQCHRLNQLTHKFSSYVTYL